MNDIIIDRNTLREFKDICVCALRYALPRNSYILHNTLLFIKENAKVILDKRVINIMLSDIELQLDNYSNYELDTYERYKYQCDIDCIENLKEFLIEYDRMHFKETD